MGVIMRLLLMVVSLMTWLCLATTANATRAVSTTAPPCWMEAFPPPNSTKSGNEITCEVCTAIFQGLDDALLGNEDQIMHALENLCEGFPRLFEICWRLVEACVDDIIEYIIKNGLNPKDMCEALF